jgi:hypothetical protein
MLVMLGDFRVNCGYSVRLQCEDELAFVNEGSYVESGHAASS